MADVRRLRGEAWRSTHLVRYVVANDALAVRVLDVPCKDCGAAIGVQCFEGS
jgi:hypothetical protein